MFADLHVSPYLHITLVLVCATAAGIVIAGSSLIVRLARYLQTPKEVFHLPLPVTFIGKSGLRIAQLRPLLDQEMSPPPALLVLHLGANDIGRLNSWQWIQELEASVTNLQARYPATKLIWSDMLPWLLPVFWTGTVPVTGHDGRLVNGKYAHLLFDDLGFEGRSQWVSKSKSKSAWNALGN